MGKKTYRLTGEVLKRFKAEGILDSVLLIGSWCSYYYKYYFDSSEYQASIRTLDLDFLVPLPVKIKKKIDLSVLLQDLGFIEDFKGRQGYIKLVHPDLTIEFLVPERGRGSDKPFPLPQLGINAQPLRYLDLLMDNIISVDAEGLKIKMPHPAAYALHKFIVFKRRRGKDKRDKDIEGAIKVIYELINNKKEASIKGVFDSLHLKWQKTILGNLKSIEEHKIIDILSCPPHHHRFASAMIFANSR